MEHWSPYCDAQLGRETDEAIGLAAMLSGASDRRVAPMPAPTVSALPVPVAPPPTLAPPTSAAHTAADDTFAVGRYCASQIRPLIQCFDLDFETTRDLQLEMTLPRSLWIGTIFRGRWTSMIGRNPLEVTGPGIPAVVAYGEPVTARIHQKAGCHVQCVSILIGAEYLTESDEAEADPALSQLATLIKTGINFRELPSFGALNTILLRMKDNPYRGRMRRIYMESLALSAIVELASLLRGTCDRGAVAHRRRDLAHEAKRILDEALASPPTAEQLARRLGTNQTTLRRLFKESFGISIMDYVIGRRLQAAQVLLRQGRLQIAEIAYRMGYSDPANFTAAYRHYFGCPPKAERSRR